MAEKKNPLRVEVHFTGGPYDGQTKMVKTSAMEAKTSGSRYVLDPNRTGEYPLQYVWRQK